MQGALKKELGLLNVFCLASGAMISSGLFILPGLAFARSGPSVIVAYILAGILCIPTVFSKAELVTAMPRAGGDYFYVMRGFGPLLGTIAGFSSWFSLSLKGTFALIGMGAYIALVSNMPAHVVAMGFCVFFILLNLVGAKEAGKLQVLLLFGVLLALLLYVIKGLGSIDYGRFTPFFSEGYGTIFATTSFVFISYGGLTKISALAEEIKDPQKNLPMGLFLSLIVTAIIYAVVIFVTVGTLDPGELRNSLTPISDAAVRFGGVPLQAVVSIGAFLSFISAANSGIMTGSRYPLSMSRDKVLPDVFRKTNPRFKVPYMSVLVTGVFMLLTLSFLRVELLVKVASSLVILLYIFANLTLILFRESKHLSYKPKFSSPLYPWLQIFGIFSGCFLLVEMGSFIDFLASMFIVMSFLWYKFYVEKRVTGNSVLMHVLENIVSKDEELSDSDDLLTEIKEIVLEEDLVMEDKFHRLIAESRIIDIEEPLKVDRFFDIIGDVIAKDIGSDPSGLVKKFVKREDDSSTVLRDGLAVPHILVDKDVFKIYLVRGRSGIIFPGDKVVHMIFIIVGSSHARNLHLKALAAIAQITQNPAFDAKWNDAVDVESLRDIVLYAERHRG